MLQWGRALNEIAALDRVQQLAKLTEMGADAKAKEAEFQQAPLLAQAKVCSVILGTWCVPLF